MAAGYTSIVLGNHPVPLKQLGIFLLRLREGVTKQKLKMILVLPFRRQLDQSSRVCSPCNNNVRSTYAGFSFIKTSFQESEHYDDSFRFKLKECRHYVDQWFRGKVMQWLKHHL